MILTEFVSMFVSLPHSRAGLAPGSVGSVSWDVFWEPGRITQASQTSLREYS